MYDRKLEPNWHIEIEFDEDDAYARHGARPAR